VFVSRFHETAVNLVLRDLGADKNWVKQLASASSGTKIKSELGFLNTDNFFSNAILFVEGATESESLPAILKFYGLIPEDVGLKIRDIEGNTKIKWSRMRETLEVIKETDILPLIILDNDTGAEARRDDILKMAEYGKLFEDQALQYRLWETNFVNELPNIIINNAIKKLLQDKKIVTKNLSKDLAAARSANSDIENFLREILHDNNSTLDKKEFGKYISQAICSCARGVKYTKRCFLPLPVIKMRPVLSI